MNEEIIIKSALDGIDEAMETYKNWSDGEWLWNAPESLITVKIGNKLYNKESNQFITLEDGIKYILNLKQTGFRGDINEIPRGEKGRADMVLWNETQPMALIEVKNSVYNFSHIKDDIERIRAILINKTTIKLGLIPFFVSNRLKRGNAKETIKKRLKN